MSAGNSSDVVRLSEASGKDPKGNSAVKAESEINKVAKREMREYLDERVKELEKNVIDLTEVSKQQDQAAKQKKPATPGTTPKPAQTRHIAHVKNWFAVAIEPDLCRVGKCVTAFNSYSTLPEMTAGSPNVKARGTRVLRKGDLIKGVMANAGQHIASGRSLGTGYLEILEGHKNVTINCRSVARHDSLCRINTNENGGVGPLARMMTMVKPVQAAPAVTSNASEPPPGQRSSKRLEELKAQKEKIVDGQFNFDASDEYFDLKKMHANADKGIALLKADRGTLPGAIADTGAQVLRGVAGFVKDMGLGIVELGYEGAKNVPKMLQGMTPSGLMSAYLDKAILLEELRLGNITPTTVGQSVLDIGSAIVKPVTEPWRKGQIAESISRGVVETLTVALGLTKAARLKKAADAKRVAEAKRAAEAAKAADEAAKVANVAEEAAEAAKAAEGVETAAQAAEKAADVAKAPELVDSAAYAADAGKAAEVIDASNSVHTEKIATVILEPVVGDGVHINGLPSKIGNQADAPVSPDGVSPSKNHNLTAEQRANETNGDAILETGASARVNASSTTTIGELFKGHSPNSMIHLTSAVEADFAAGIHEGTFFARLGDVSHLTPLQFKIGVVGPVAGGYGPEANLFVRVSADVAYDFDYIRKSAFGYKEYTNSWVVDADQFIKIPNGPELPYVGEHLVPQKK